MPYAEVTTEAFGGLNLVDDPPEAGWARAIDMLDVDLDRRGRVRQRDGYDNFTSSAHSSRFRYVAPYYQADGTKQLLASAAAGTAVDAIVAYDTAGVLVAGYDPGASRLYGKPVSFGTSSGELSLIPLQVQSGGGNGIIWNGATFNDATAGVHSEYDLLAVQASDNRLVGARASSTIDGSSEVGFSGPGVLSRSADDFVRITPGDGEFITAIVGWSDLVFAFKETKFAVFYGNSTDPTGGAVFNYRMINSGDGCAGSLTSSGVACAGRPGVFFMNRRGIYLTQGVGEPRLMSRAVDPLFTGNLPATFSGNGLNDAQIALADMTWMDERLYVTFPTGSSTSNDRMLVWDSIRDEWELWSIPAGGVCSFRQGNTEELHFSYATGSNHIGRHSASFTTDDGANISAFYRSGFSDLGSGNVKRLRQTQLFGTGNVGYSMATDYGAADSAATVTLGTSPAVDDAYDRISRRGRLFSFRLASVSGGVWAVHRIANHIADQRLSGLG